MRDEEAGVRVPEVVVKHTFTDSGPIGLLLGRFDSTVMESVVRSIEVGSMAEDQCTLLLADRENTNKTSRAR